MRGPGGLRVVLAIDSHKNLGFGSRMQLVLGKATEPMASSAGVDCEVSKKQQGRTGMEQSGSDSSCLHQDGWHSPGPSIEDPCSQVVVPGYPSHLATTAEQNCCFLNSYIAKNHGFSSPCSGSCLPQEGYGEFYRP